MNEDYNSAEIEKKWQRIWDECGIYKTDISDTDKALYCLVMFLYPSGDRLHIGHWYNYAPTDTWARFKRMQGYNVFEPMGYDAFGLPAENYAIKMGIHPKASTENNTRQIREQLKTMGAMYDWNMEVNTSSPDYYKWTQWIFLQLYKHNLAYRKKAAANWCPQCQTVLANEQVVDGACERCETEVITKDLEQWFFKITDYAEKLLEGHDRIQWPEKTILMQKNWIGRSQGAVIDFKVNGYDDIIQVFTTRPDTLYGVTYMVLAPEHPLVEKLSTPENKSKVDAYIVQARKQREIDRLSTEKEKTGIFLGNYCTNPVDNKSVPIWIADYVLVTYGTGAVMAVPAHDQRDFEFAQKYSLPIREVISKNGQPSQEKMECAYENPGIMINSDQFNGMKSEKGITDVIKYLKEKGVGDSKVTYKLRDWLISRQRYWGAPIPIIYCSECGEVPVPEEDLPVKLPEKVDFTGKGVSPLGTAPDFVNTTCPQCGKPGKREIDTMDTFVCSSWYFLRFPNPKLSDRPFDSEIVNKWLPVHQYVGGAEHAVMHLLYARFVTKALYDFGYFKFDEPFQSLVHQGTITNKGAKMSKSRGNVINPDSYIDEYGADTFRMYMMFMGSYEEGGDWSDEGLVGIHRFLKRVWRIVLQINDHRPIGSENEKFLKVLHQLHYAIKNTTRDLERFHFNTSISRIMELVNEISLYIQDVPVQKQNKDLFDTVTMNLVKLIAPFAPHFAEELWKRIGQPFSVQNESWPRHDEKMLVQQKISMGVQINGKIRAQIEIDLGTDEQAIIQIAMQDPKVSAYVSGKEIVKSFVIQNKLVSLVTK